MVIQSCVEVGAHSFIEDLPKGYDTKVGDKGSQLSGGQKQRIGIARAIISSPKILIFDEVTSALDVESERVVEMAIKKVAMDRTTVIISHKLSFVQQADKIVLLKNGSLIEEGTHQSLAALNGTYSRFLKAQELHTTTQEGLNASPDVEILSEKKAISPTEGNIQITKDFTGGHDEFDISIPQELSLVRCLYSVITFNQTSIWLFIALAPVSVMAGAIYPAQAIVFGNSVSGFGNVLDIQHHENFWALIWLVAAVGTFVAFLAMGMISSVMSSIAKFHYETGYFDSMLRQAPQFFDHENYTAGNLIASLSLHTKQIQNLVNILGFLLVAFVSIISCSILALATEWRLALVGLFGSLPVIVFAGYLRIHTGARKSKSLSEPLFNSAQYAAEVIGAVRTVAALTMEAEVCQQLEKKMAEGLSLFYKSIFTTMPLFAFSESGNFLGTHI
jgi:ATP-binding cassette subfamily B (MDR/TAP) protein 1